MLLSTPSEARHFCNYCNGFEKRNYHGRKKSEMFSSGKTTSSSGPHCSWALTMRTLRWWNCFWRTRSECSSSPSSLSPPSSLLLEVRKKTWCQIFVLDLWGSPSLPSIRNDFFFFYFKLFPPLSFSAPDILPLENCISFYLNSLFPCKTNYFQPNCKTIFNYANFCIHDFS